MTVPSTPTPSTTTAAEPLPIIGGRQMPAAGSKRRKAMEDVKRWLTSHGGGGTNATIASALGISPNRVAEARLDLSLFDALLVAIPTPLNGNRVTANGWDRAAMRGELTQARHNATRLEREAVRFDKAALAATDPAEAEIIAAQAGRLRWQGASLRKLQAALEAALAAPTP